MPCFIRMANRKPPITSPPFKVSLSFAQCLQREYVTPAPEKAKHLNSFRPANHQLWWQSIGTSNGSGIVSACDCRPGIAGRLGERLRTRMLWPNAPLGGRVCLVGFKNECA
ncbi:hypothetical protein TRVL_05519 [Trypanosoma vivax]|nr:hypothetical protein TRVL_05519 [Trypanosoma vivax]